MTPVNLLTTTATFPQAGLYTLQIKVRDDALNATDQILIVVNTLPAGTWGDCNGDTFINAADLSAIVLEIFDDDGNFWLDTAGDGFAGTPQCDANQDTTINAADISCTVLHIFNVPGACGVLGA